MELPNLRSPSKVNILYVNGDTLILVADKVSIYREERWKPLGQLRVRQSVGRHGVCAHAQQRYLSI